MQPYHTAILKGRARSWSRRRVADERPLDHHILVLSLKVDRHDAHGPETHNGVGWVVTWTGHTGIEQYRLWLADNAGQVILDARANAGIAAEGQCAGVVEAEDTVGREL